METVKISEDFSIPVPKTFRERYNLSPNIEVVLEEQEGGILIRKASRKEISDRILQILKNGLSDIEAETVHQVRKHDRCL